MSNELDYTKLVAQGRAKAFGVPWSEAELTFLVSLGKPLEEGGRGLARSVAADYLRAGVLTLEAYDKAVADGLVPETLEEVKARLGSPQLKPKAEVAEAPVEPSEPVELGAKKGRKAK